MDGLEEFTKARSQLVLTNPFSELFHYDLNLFQMSL